MRILFGADTFPPDVNGSAKFTSRLAAGLVERGHEVHVVAPAASRKHGVWTETHEGQRMVLHRWYSWKWPWHTWIRFAIPWRAKANAARTIDLVQPDVVHFQSHVVTGRGLAFVAKRRGLRLIGTNHTMPENLVQHVTVLPQGFIDSVVRLQWRSAARWYGMCDEVTAPTQRAADYFEKHTRLRGVHAISCGIDMRDYTPMFGPRPERIITFVGRIEEEKYIHELLEAAAKLQGAFDRVEIIGDGEVLPQLRERARELGIADRVHLAGPVTDAVLRHTLSVSTVFAMPSRAELQSIATMEAMASGLPVVAANAMALPHLAHDGVNGHLYEPGDIDAFSAGLADVLSASQERYEQMQRASLEIVKRHDITHTIDAFEAMYRGERVTDPVTDDRDPRAESRRPWNAWRARLPRIGRYGDAVRGGSSAG